MQREFPIVKLKIVNPHTLPCRYWDDSTSKPGDDVWLEQSLTLRLAVKPFGIPKPMLTTLLHSAVSAYLFPDDEVRRAPERSR